MIHCYKLGGLNIVLDICSGSVHAVDDIAYDIIAMFESSTREEIVAAMLAKYGMRADVTEAELNEALAQTLDAVGAKFALPVAHVGRAFAAYAAAHPEAELYDPDLLHPSLLGSTLAAETILQEVLQIYEMF